jgi:hypothetical protein
MGVRFDFGPTKLDRVTKKRLSSMEESRFHHPAQKTALANKLATNHYDVRRGLHVPLTSTVASKGKVTEACQDVPIECSARNGFPFPLFCNALLLPRPDASTERPTLRATNPGFVVTTIEHDPVSVEGLEESINWTCDGGLIFKVDAELAPYKDYAGFCTVWSGHKSVHFHFVFVTTHLSNAPYDATAKDRWHAFREHAAVLAAAHKRYFETASQLCTSIFASTMKPDPSMRSLTQYRRTPWGNRMLEQDSDILGVEAGTLLPQLVLCEKLRFSRAPKGSSRFLVAPDLTSDLSFNSHTAERIDDARHIGAGSQLRAELQSMCAAEWNGEYPKPFRMWRDRGEWIINFQNHPADRNPSTVCRGNHNGLLVQGAGAPDGPFVLPGELTANELGDHLALRFGLMSLPAKNALNNSSDSGLSHFERLKRKRGRSSKQAHEEAARDNFPIRSSDNIDHLQHQYRHKLWAACADRSSFNCDAVILSAEGIGKTRTLFRLLSEDALDTALDTRDGRIRFNAFAFRSEAQAVEKAEEYRRETGRPCLVWRSFWTHYVEVCQSLDRRPIPKEKFDEESNIVSMLYHIRSEQQTVFNRLEEVRRRLWTDSHGGSMFHPNTVLFTTHATVMTWLTGQVTRTWHHPAFGLSMTDDEMRSLREQMVLQNIAFDEPEYDELIWLLTSDLYEHLASVKQWDWKRRSPKERRELFASLARWGAIPSELTFEEYNELRYLDLATLQRVEVNFWSQPFGRENKADSIYRAWHQKPFYLGVKRWPFAGSARITYLTTETFTTEAIAAVYAKAAEPLLKLELDRLPPLYPIAVPTAKDKRARAQNIKELVREILASNEKAVVIADGLGDMKGSRAMTFQGMKGHNGLSAADIYIISTSLAPEVYARLNVLGQWTGNFDTLTKYYAAQISQAVGRNTGFRQQAGTRSPTDYCALLDQPCGNSISDSICCRHRIACGEEGRSLLRRHHRGSISGTASRQKTPPSATPNSM